MKYKLLCDVKAKQGREERVNYSQVNVYVEVYDSHANNYGNGKGLFIEFENDIREFCDIRYDRDYNRMKEHLYVQEFVKSYAHNNLIFEITQLHLQSIFE